MEYSNEEQKIINDLSTLAYDLVRQIEREKWDDVYSNLEDLRDMMEDENFPSEAFWLRMKRRFVYSKTVEKYYEKRLNEVWKKAYKVNDEEMMRLIERIDLEYNWIMRSD